MVDVKLCKCGCGKPVSHDYFDYVIGHNNIKIKERICKCGCGQPLATKKMNYIVGHKPSVDSPLPLCACGCGGTVSNHYYKYLVGHYAKALSKSMIKEQKPKRMCVCGCGRELTYEFADYIKGHQNIGKPTHNKGGYKVHPDCDRMIHGWLSEETKNKISQASKGRKISEVAKENLRNIMRGNPDCGRKGGENAFFGRKHSDEAKRIIGEKSKLGYKVSGENHPLWLGGKSFEPYTKEFSRQVKELVGVRDNFTCQLCGVPENESLKILARHHIDYDKANSIPDNLVCLCGSCHTRTNVHREYWSGYFKALIKERKYSPNALVIKRKDKVAVDNIVKSGLSFEEVAYGNAR